MTLLFIDGFGDQVTGTLIPVGWTGSNAVLGAATGRFGGAGVAPPSGTGNTIIRSFTASATVIVGMAIYPTGDAWQSSSAAMLQVGGDGGTTMHLTWGRQAGGTIVLMRGGGNGTVIATSTLTMPLNTWSYIECKATIDDSSGTCIIKVNGQEFINFTGDTRNGGTSTNLDTLRVGGAGWVPVIDDVYVCNTSGSVNNDFLGDSRVIELYPNGNGNSSQGTGSDGNSTDNYLLVDEAGAPSTADYVDFTAGEKDTYTFTNTGLSSGTVRGVQVRCHASKTDTGTVGLYTVARLAGTEVDGSTNHYPGTSFTYYTDAVMETKPGGGAWSLSDVDSAEFGVRGTT